MLQQSQWIWNEAPAATDSYCEFYDSFPYADGDVLLTISCDSNYAVYLNGELAVFGQYADFEHYKIADTVDVTPFCRSGQNHLAIIVWYYGMPHSTYCPGKAGLFFELTCDEQLLAYSSTATMCRRSRAYRSEQKKLITWQLGFSFDYDAAKEDGWMTGNGTGFAPALAVEKSRELLPRPNKKLVLEDRTPSALIAEDGQYRYLFDLGREEVGFLELELDCEAAQTVTVAYGEHLRGGTVAQLLGERDFSVTYRTKPGHNLYTNPFRRLGCRYLELRSEAPLCIRYAGIRPTMYPLVQTEFMPKDELDRKIYEVCVRTLQLCLHEHYEDCPWREQSFYTMDSRNQMLCGYIAFNEFEAPRAGLALFAQDRNDNGLLSICCPNQSGCLQIPSFSLHYFTAVDEYIQYSGDKTLAPEIYEKLCSILQAFAARKENGLIRCFEGKNAWNFYEWRTLLDGDSGAPDCDLILNCLYVLAAEHMASIVETMGIDGAPYRAEAAETRNAIRRVFFRPDTKLFSTFADTEHYSELGNSLAVLCGAAGESEKQLIAQQLTEAPERFVPASLSMKCFAYDALLEADREKYAGFVLDQIRRRYQMMLDQDATTVWEDEDGAEAFHGAGSLCHGWSSIPIYYYSILREKL